ncbi:MAG: hypothetical protein IH600_16180 [Bacteroidetes bacterium]|nr:hypothetical protein [Bacteroidota bacterium]
MSGNDAETLVNRGQKKRALSPIVSTVITLAVLTIVLMATNGQKVWSDVFTRTRTIDRLYDYREIAAVYDSVDIKLTYGEMFFINDEDSSHIYAESVYDSTWYCDSKANVNNKLTWKAFPCNNNTVISIWKAASFCVADTNFTNLCFPDTVSWVLRLYDASSGFVLATLDSTVLFRTMTGRDFPEAYGFQSSDVWEHDSWRIGDVVPGNVDSVYLKAEVDAFAGNDSDFFLSDSFTINAKFSDDAGFSKARETPTNSSVINSLVFTIDAYPNPVSSGKQLNVRFKADQDFSGRLCLINTLGQVLHTFKSGRIEKNTYSYSYSLERSLPSGSYWIILASRANEIVDKTEVILVK